MVTKEQKANTKRNLLMTLSYLSSADEQRKYKEAVPFVHIPYELLAQWEAFSRLLKEKRKWFCDFYSPEQVAAMMEFDKKVDQFSSQFPNEIKTIPDIPEVLNCKDWNLLMLESQKLHLIINEQDKPSVDPETQH